MVRYFELLSDSNLISDDLKFNQMLFSGQTDEGSQDGSLSSQAKAKGLALYRGKVRDVYVSEDTVYMVHSDRLSAFDKHIGCVPLKGAMLASISTFWWQFLGNEIPNHYIATTHPRVIKAKKCQPFQVEVVVRGYLAGSMMRAYNKGERHFCGNKLPDGLSNHCRLPELIITPTTKAAVYEKDLPISPEDLIKNKICTESEWQQISSMAFKLFKTAEKVYGDRGWIFVDTKYEFGRSSDGQIVVIDEIHTPDSSRLWEKQSYKSRIEGNKQPEMFDKEVIRRFLERSGFTGDGAVPEVPRSKYLELALIYAQTCEQLGLKSNSLEEINSFEKADCFS